MDKETIKKKINELSQNQIEQIFQRRQRFEEIECQRQYLLNQVEDSSEIGWEDVFKRYK